LELYFCPLLKSGFCGKADMGDSSPAGADADPSKLGVKSVLIPWGREMYMHPAAPIDAPPPLRLSRDELDYIGPKNSIWDFGNLLPIVCVNPSLF